MFPIRARYARRLSTSPSTWTTTTRPALRSTQTTQVGTTHLVHWEKALALQMGLKSLQYSDFTSCHLNKNILNSFS